MGERRSGVGVRVALEQKVGLRRLFSLSHLDLQVSVQKKRSFSLDGYALSFWVKIGRYSSRKRPIWVFVRQRWCLTRFSVPLLLRPR